MYFFITGLPRSRTAWLSNLFTYKDCYCFHELAKFGKNFHELRDVFLNRGEGYIGTADPSLPFYYEDIAPMFPNNKLVIIERDLEEVIKSLSGFWMPDEQIKELVEKTYIGLQNLKDKFNPLVIKYEDIDKLETIEQLWYYCVPGITFDKQRFDMLEQFRIEVHETKYLLNMNDNNIFKLVGVT